MASPSWKLFPGARFTEVQQREVVQQSDVTILAVKPQVAAGSDGRAQAHFRRASCSSPSQPGVTLEKDLRLASAHGARRAGHAEYADAGRCRRERLRGRTECHRGRSRAGAIAFSRRQARRGPWRKIRSIPSPRFRVAGRPTSFHFMDALIRGAVAQGLPEQLAKDLTLQTVLGSAQLASGSPAHAARTRHASEEPARHHARRLRRSSRRTTR